jgi:hypothetical protein
LRATRRLSRPARGGLPAGEGYSPRTLRAAVGQPEAGPRLFVLVLPVPRSECYGFGIVPVDDGRTDENEGQITGESDTSKEQTFLRVDCHDRCRPHDSDAQHAGECEDCCNSLHIPAHVRSPGSANPSGGIVAESAPIAKCTDPWVGGVLLAADTVSPHRAACPGCAVRIA